MKIQQEDILLSFLLSPIFLFHFFVCLSYHYSSPYLLFPIVQNITLCELQQSCYILHHFSILYEVHSLRYHSWRYAYEISSVIENVGYVHLLLNNASRLIEHEWHLSNIENSCFSCECKQTVSSCWLSYMKLYKLIFSTDFNSLKP